MQAPLDQDKLAELQRLWAQLLPAGSAVAHYAASSDELLPQMHKLFPEEAHCISRAVNKRRCEFLAGRLCARNALADIGAGMPAIPTTDNRAPQFPIGLSGSITHTELSTFSALSTPSTQLIYAAAAAIHNDNNHGSIGIDAEQSTPLEPETLAITCRQSERQRLTQLPPVNWLTTASNNSNNTTNNSTPDKSTEQQHSLHQGSWAKVLFSAKESYYKAQYPLTQLFVDFLDVDLHLTPDANNPQSGSFSIDNLHTDLKALALTSNIAIGRYACTAELILTACYLVPSQQLSPARSKEQN